MEEQREELQQTCHNHVHKFPITVTNNHKFTGLKQHRFITLQSWGSEVQNQSYELKSRHWPGCVHSRGSKRVSISWPLLTFLSLLAFFIGSWSLSFIFKARNIRLSPFHAAIFLVLSLCSPILLIRTLGMLGHSNNPG